MTPSLLDTEEEIVRMEDVARARRRDDQGGTPTCAADEASRRSLLAERLRFADRPEPTPVAPSALGEGGARALASSSPDLLFAYHLLAWSEAIEDGHRRTFEEWGA